MSEDPFRYYAGPPLPQQPLLEALVVDREWLIRVLRVTVAELHSRRLATPPSTGPSEIIELLHYWDEVLDWVKQQGGADIVLMNRRSQKVT